jgi:hypothetical protein
MKFFYKGKDGGPESPVTGYFLVEMKSLFSIVLLHFGGTREAYHSHAFNAVTIWLTGTVTEKVKFEDMEVARSWSAGDIKYTPRHRMHKIVPVISAWAISFRGPWIDHWQEFKQGKLITLTHGRKVVGNVKG